MRVLSYVFIISLISCSEKEGTSHEGSNNLSSSIASSFSDVEQVEENQRLEENQGLIGGVVVDQKLFPANVYTRNFRKNGTVAKCTASIVGERALIQAAHCVDDGAVTEFTTVNKIKYESVCKRNPTYNTSHTADYALCLVKEKVKDVPYESLNDDQNYVKVGDSVLLTGFGCIRSNGTGGNDGKFRIGEAVINRVPDPRRSSNDYVTTAPIALCFGDSGGPAYKVVGNARKIISINSRGDIKTTSYLSSVSRKEAIDFFKAWMNETGEKICGLHSGAVGCR
jgi:hypothetical protein